MAKEKTATNEVGGAEAVKEMTAADAANLVVRGIPVIGKDRKPTGEVKRAPVKASEVLSFRDCGDSVVVVTTDGQKLTGDKAAK
jgi:hypothetical protein